MTIGQHIRKFCKTQNLYQDDVVNLAVLSGAMDANSRFCRHAPVLLSASMKHLAQTIKALSDPIRLRIVLLLQAEGELCVCDLMAVLKLPQSTVSRHLAYLKRSCWVDTRRDGLWMHYMLSRESCELCRELLQILTQHAVSFPEAISDRRALTAFLKDKPAGCL